MNDKLYAELIVNKALNIKDGSILRIKQTPKICRLQEKLQRWHMKKERLR